MKKQEYVPCPYCGEMIKSSARACKHCGSDERTGWSDDTYLDGIDIGDEDFDYEETAAREFSHGNYPRNWLKSWKTITGILLLLLFLIMVMRYSL